jgi:hypothetical protein
MTACCIGSCGCKQWRPKASCFLWENFEDVTLRIVGGKPVIAKRCHHCGQILDRNPAGCNSHLAKHVREIEARKAKAVSA